MEIWRAADYPWSARLVAMLPTWMPHARVHLNLCDEVERLLLSMSARSIDRLLQRHRTDMKRRIYGRTKPGTLLKHHIPVRTERWDTTEVGWCETDTVAHCGEVGEGEFAFSVNLTDVASTGRKPAPCLAKGSASWSRRSRRYAARLPLRCGGSIPTAVRSSSTIIAMAGASSMGSSSLAGAHIARTTTPTSSKRTGRTSKDLRMEAYRCAAAIEAMNGLYRNELRLFLNYFQPSVKLIERTALEAAYAESMMRRKLHSSDSLSSACSLRPRLPRCKLSATSSTPSP